MGTELLIRVDTGGPVELDHEDSRGPSDKSPRVSTVMGSSNAEGVGPSLLRVRRHDHGVRN